MKDAAEVDHITTRELSCYCLSITKSGATRTSDIGPEVVIRLDPDGKVVRL